MSITAAINGVKASAQELMPFIWDKKQPTAEAKPMTKSDVDLILKRYNLSN